MKTRQPSRRSSLRPVPAVPAPEEVDVTLLFCDVVRSTELTRRLGDRGAYGVIQEFHDLVLRAAKPEGGHELGNHTYHHRYLPLARRRSVEHELRATDRAIEDATGIVPRIARPPWGARRPSTVRAFARLAKRLVLWDVNSYDWKGRPAHEIVERVLERVKSGSIVLLHEARDGGEVTIEAVRLLVPALRARGYTLVTASEAIA